MSYKIKQAIYSDTSVLILLFITIALSASLVIWKEFFYYSEYMVFIDKCHSQGGKIYQPYQSDPFCIKPNQFIEIK